MDTSRLKKLAGINEGTCEMDVLTEVVEIPNEPTIDQIISMLDAAKKGLGLANKLRDPTDRKKHVKAVFVNMNKIRAALGRLIKEQ